MATDREDAVDTAGATLEAIRARFDELARTGAPGLRAFAAWLADQPEELAFHSVRSLAEQAGADPNVVVRSMKAVGFSGYADARRAVQNVLRHAELGYVGRADALRRIGKASLLETMSEAAQSNVRQVFSPELCAAMEEVVPHLISARRVHCIGVRMPYALSHYFTYRGRIAHANVQPAPNLPGLILDGLIDSGPEDIVMVISFVHYSAEVLRAAEVARRRGARVLALTDRRDSPLAQRAWRVLRAPIEGPNVMQTLSGALLIMEALLELMAASDPNARGRLEAFERGLLDVGAYARLN